MYADSKIVSRKKLLEAEVFSLFHLTDLTQGALSFPFPRSSPEVWGLRGEQPELCGSQSRERISSQVCTELKTTGFMSYLFHEAKLRRIKVPAGLSGGDSFSSSDLIWRTTRPGLSKCPYILNVQGKEDESMGCALLGRGQSQKPKA